MASPWTSPPAVTSGPASGCNALAGTHPLQVEARQRQLLVRRFRAALVQTQDRPVRQHRQVAVRPTPGLEHAPAAPELRIVARDAHGERVPRLARRVAE